MWCTCRGIVPGSVIYTYFSHLSGEQPIPKKNLAYFRKKPRSSKLFVFKLPFAPPSNYLLPKATEEKECFTHLWPPGEFTAIDRSKYFLTRETERYQGTRKLSSPEFYNMRMCITQRVRWLKG